MYYQITNKESKTYKALFELRTKEIQIEKDNKEAVRNMVGNDWDEFLGQNGQQNFQRCTQYTGFAFKHPDRLPAKTWKQHKEFPDIYVPDNRTKNGKLIRKFLDELPHSSIIDVFRILGCELGGRFAYPYVEICPDESIVFYMSERYHETLTKNKDIVEITSSAFEKLLEEKE